MNDKLIMFVIFSAPFMLVAAARWRQTIMLVFFLMVIEGAIRKWIFPGLQSQIYLIKDGILLAAYMGFIATAKPPGAHRDVTGPLAAVSVATLLFLAAQLANPNSPSLLLGVIGLKNYLLYVPLAFIVPYLFNSSQDLERKLEKYALIMLPAAALGIVQFTVGADNWLNTYVSQEEGVAAGTAYFGIQAEKARTSGTFSYIGGYVTFLTAMVYLAIAMMMGRYFDIIRIKSPLVVAIISAAAMFTTGSRTPFYGLVATAPIILYIGNRSRMVLPRTVVQCAIAIPLIMFAVSMTVPDAIVAYNYRAGNSDDPIGRLLTPVTQLADAFEVSPFIGMGMASSHGAAATVMGSKSYWWLQGHFFELETARTLQEIGVIGLVLVFGVRVYLVFLAFWLVKVLRKPPHKALAACIACFLLQHVALSVINNPTAGIYYWTAVGLLFTMVNLERKESQNALAREPESLPLNAALHPWRARASYWTIK